MEEGEPGSLAEVWALTGRLEEQPLELLVLVRVRRSGELVLGVVLVDDIDEDRVGLPEV